jgi:hypothetical protein
MNKIFNDAKASISFRKFFLFLLAISLPIAVYCKWTTGNARYPIWDEGAYFTLTQEAYLEFKNEGFMEGLHYAYDHKHWKPILHPLLAIPFLFLTDGDVRMAIFLYNGLLFFLFLSLAYLYLCRYLKEEAAVICTAMMGLIPWVFGLFTSFNSEVTFVTTALAVFVTFENQFNFKNLHKCVTASVLLSLAMTLRPVETTLIFSLLVFLLLAKSFLSKEVTGKEIAIVTIWLVAYFLVLLPPYYLLKGEYSGFAESVIYFLAAAFFAFTIYYTKLKKLNFNFVLSFGIFFFVTIIWYAGSAYTLLNWIISTNFEMLAIEMGNRFGKPISDFFIFYSNKIGVILILLLGLGLIGQFNFFKFLKIKQFFVLFVFCIIVPVLVGLLTYNGDVRYYYAGWCILFLVLATFALNSNARFYLFRFFLVLTLCMSLFFNIFQHMYSVYFVNLPVFSYLGFSRFDYSLKLIDHSPEIVKNYIETIDPIPPGAYLKTLIITNTWSHLIIHHQELALAMGEKNLPIIIHMKGEYDFELDENFYSLANAHYDYLIVGPIESGLEVHPKAKVIDKISFSNCNYSKNFKSPDLSMQFDFVKKVNYTAFADAYSQNPFPFTICIYKNILKKPSFGKTYH